MSEKNSKSEKAKKRYQDDSNFRQGLIDRAKKRYWKRRPPLFVLTPEEKTMLFELNSYPCTGPGTLGTGDEPCNVKLIKVNGQIRVKGTIFLEQFAENQKRKRKKC